MTAPEAGWLRSKSSIAVRAPEPYGHTCDCRDFGSLVHGKALRLLRAYLRQTTAVVACPKKQFTSSGPATVSFATARARARVTTSFKGQDGCTASAALFAVCFCLKSPFDQAHQPENGGGHCAALNKQFTCLTRDTIKRVALSGLPSGRDPDLLWRARREEGRVLPELLI